MINSCAILTVENLPPYLYCVEISQMNKDSYYLLEVRFDVDRRNPNYGFYKSIRGAKMDYCRKFHDKERNGTPKWVKAT